MPRLLQRLTPLISAVLFVTALWILSHELQEHGVSEVIAALRSVPLRRFLFAGAATAFCYFILTGYELLALRFIRVPQCLRSGIFAAFVGYAFTNNLGCSPLTGGSLRLRLYAKHGLTPLQIMQLVTMNLLTFCLGFTALAGALFVLSPPDLPSALPLSLSSIRMLGGMLLLLWGGFFAMTFLRRTALHLEGKMIPLPSPRMTLLQTLLAAAELFCASLIIFPLLAPTASLSFPDFLAAFLLAHIAGLLSQVPGGLGVFETVLVELLGESVGVSRVVSALLLYRFLYNVLPLLLAALLLAGRELHTHRHLFPRLWLRRREQP